MAGGIEKAEEYFKYFLGQVAVLIDEDMCSKIYGFSIDEHLENGEEFAILCNTYADEIEKTAQDAGQTTAKFAATGIVNNLSSFFPISLGLPIEIGADAATRYVTAMFKGSNTSNDDNTVLHALAKFENRENILAKWKQQLNEKFSDLVKLTKENPKVLEVFESYGSGNKKFDSTIVYQDVSVVKNYEMLFAKSFAAFISEQLNATETLPECFLTGFHTATELCQKFNPVSSTFVLAVAVCPLLVDIQVSELAKMYREVALACTSSIAEIKKEIVLYKTMIANCQEEAEKIFKELLSIIALLADDEMFNEVYGFTMEEYLTSRKEFAELCRTHATYIEKIVQETGIARVTGGAVSIAAGAAGIAGLFLAPFTAGASLALTAGAVAGGVAGATTTFTAALVQDRNVKSNEEAIQEALNKFEKEEKIVTELLQKLNNEFKKLHELMQNDPTVLKLIENYALGATKLGWSIVYNGVNTVKTINAMMFARSVAAFIQADFKAMQGIAQGFASPGIGLFGKTLIVAGSTTAKLLSGALSVVGIGFGVYDVVEGCKDIEGSELANKYREFADTHDGDTVAINEQIDRLKNMIK